MIKRNSSGQFIGKEIPIKAKKLLGKQRDSEIAKLFDIHRYTVVQWRNKLNIKSPLKQWSYKYSKCKLCGTTEYKHRMNGYCIKCYTKSPEHKKNRLQWYYNNKIQVKLSRKKYYKNHRDKILEQTARYKIQNKIRCSDNYPPIYWLNRIKLIFEKELPCKICGSTNKNKLETHHVVPIKLAKSKKWTDKKIHSIANLLVVCQNCHRLNIDSIHSTNLKKVKI